MDTTIRLKHTPSAIETFKLTVLTDRSTSITLVLSAGSAWFQTYLTPAEAREAASALLAMADAIEEALHA